MLCGIGLVLFAFRTEKSVVGDYVKRLRSYEGATYIWGGENGLGIDCSGLPRRAFRQAILSQALRDLDLAGIVRVAQHWWYGISASALRQGYRDYVLPLGVDGTIRTLALDELAAGDLAITTNGVHVIVYLGDGEWIQASPDDWQVTIQQGATGESAWFESEVDMFRWAVID